MMEGNEGIRTRSPVFTIRDVTLPQLLMALHSPLETWKVLDKVKYKSMELISMVNMDVARNGDNVVLSNTNGHLQKCVGVLSSLEEALTMVLLSPESNLKFGVESLRNLGNGVEETDEMSMFGAHGGINPNGEVSHTGGQLGSTRSGLPYLERFLQNYIRRVDDIVCQIESQLKSSTRVQESRYASVVLQAHGLRPSVAEYLVTNLYLRVTGISAMQNWVLERVNKLNLESQTFEQLMERDSGNSSVYMSAVQHENHRVQEELKALRTAERILQYLERLERKEKKYPHHQDGSVGSVLSNDWETFARFLTRIYTLINSSIEVLSDISPLRRELIMEERKTWADFQRNSSREMRVLDESLNGNLLSQDDQQQSNFYEGRRSIQGAIGVERSRFQTPSWARGSSDPPIPSTRFADKQFMHYQRLSEDADRTPVSAFRRIPGRGDHERHQSHPSHHLHNPYCTNVYRNQFNEINQLPQQHSELPFVETVTTAENLVGYPQNIGGEYHRDPYDLTHIYNRLYSSRLSASNHLHPHMRCRSTDHVSQPHEHPTPTSVNDALISSLLLDIRSMRQTMSEYDNYFRTITDSLRIQQESISDLRRLVGSGNRNITDMDNRVEQVRTMLQHLQPSSNNSSVYHLRREHPTHQHQYEDRIGRAGAHSQSQSLYDTLLYSSNLDLRIGNNEDSVDSFLGNFARTPRDINLSPRPPPCYSEVVHLDNDASDNSTMAMLQQMPSQEDSPTEELPYLMTGRLEHRLSSPNLDDPAEILSPPEVRDNDVQHQGRRRRHRLGSDQSRQSPGLLGHQAVQNNSVSVTLNNQVAPGSRANNYWDNFKSYSHQNLLSTSKSNRSGGGSAASPSGSEGHTAGSTGSRLVLCNNTAVEEPSSSLTGVANSLSGNNTSRRNSRSEKSGTGGKTALSGNFVENIGLKKRNELGKQGSMGVTSPSRSNSSNSIPCQEMSGGAHNMFAEEIQSPSYLGTDEEHSQATTELGRLRTSDSLIRENDLNQPTSSHPELPQAMEEVAGRLNYEVSSNVTASSRQDADVSVTQPNLEYPSTSNPNSLEQTSTSYVLPEESVMNLKPSEES